MSKLVTIRLAEQTVQTIDKLVKQGLFRSRNRAIEQWIQESLEKRGLIEYKDVSSE